MGTCIPARSVEAVIREQCPFGARAKLSRGHVRLAEAADSQRSNEVSPAAANAQPPRPRSRHQGSHPGTSHRAPTRPAPPGRSIRRSCGQECLQARSSAGDCNEEDPQREVRELRDGDPSRLTIAEQPVEERHTLQILVWLLVRVSNHERLVSNRAREVHGSNARVSETRRRETSNVATGPTIGASLHRWIPTGSKQLRATTEMTSSHLVVITPPIREARSPKPIYR